MRRPLLVLVLACGLLAPTVAFAQNVMVLGVRSVEGDDEFARNLTGALRHAASQVEGWDVSEREVTLSQMLLAHGCDEPDPTCMAAIADSLGVTRVIYGQVRRTSAGEHFDFQVNLHSFNGESDEIEHSVADTVPGVRRDIDDLREPARRWAAALSGAPRAGVLTVQVNVPGAEVRIDGEPVGRADEDGRLRIEGVEAGMRNVQIVAEGHATFRSSVSVEAYGEAVFEAELEEGGAGGGLPVDLIAGGGLLAAGVGLAVGWIYSMARIDSIDGSAQWDDFRNRYTHVDLPDGVADICAENSNGSAVDSTELADLCDEASSLEVLQFVFGIGAAAAAGVGAYLLVQGLTGDEDAEPQAFQLTPSVGPDHAYLGALVHF